MSNPRFFNVLAVFSIDSRNGARANRSRPMPVHWLPMPEKMYHTWRLPTPIVWWQNRWLFFIFIYTSRMTCTRPTVVGENKIIKIIIIYSLLLRERPSRRERYIPCKCGRECFGYELRTIDRKTRDLWAGFRPTTTKINLIINATEKILSIGSRLVAAKKKSFRYVFT